MFMVIFLNFVQISLVFYFPASGQQCEIFLDLYNCISLVNAGSFASCHYEESACHHCLNVTSNVLFWSVFYVSYFIFP